MIAPADLVLAADRVSLRKIDRSDTSALFEMFSHAEVMRYWSRPAMTDKAQADALFEQVLADYETGNSLPLSDTGFYGLLQSDWRRTHAPKNIAPAR